MKNALLICLLIFVNGLFAQVGIGTNTPNSSAKLDVVSTSKGVLVPRMTNTQMLAISSPTAGLQVFNTTKNCLYTYSGTAWMSEKLYIGQFVNKGDVVELNNIRIRIPSTGNVSLQIATVSGSIALSGSSINNYYLGTAGSSGVSSITNSGRIRQSETFSTTYAYWAPGLDFTYHGCQQIIYIMDETNGKAYKLTCNIGNSFVNNYLEIEQLL